MNSQHQVTILPPNETEDKKNSGTNAPAEHTVSYDMESSSLLLFRDSQHDLALHINHSWDTAPISTIQKFITNKTLDIDTLQVTLIYSNDDHKEKISSALKKVFSPCKKEPKMDCLHLENEGISLTKTRAYFYAKTNILHIKKEGCFYQRQYVGLFGEKRKEVTSQHTKEAFRCFHDLEKSVNSVTTDEKEIGKGILDSTFQEKLDELFESRKNIALDKITEIEQKILAAEKFLPADKKEQENVRHDIQTLFQAYLIVASAYLSQGEKEKEKAMPFLEKASQETFNPTALSFYLQAHWHEKVGQFDSAQSCYSKGLEKEETQSIRCSVTIKMAQNRLKKSESSLEKKEQEEIENLLTQAETLAEKIEGQKYQKTVVQRKKQALMTIIENARRELLKRIEIQNVKPLSDTTTTSTDNNKGELAKPTSQSSSALFFNTSQLSSSSLLQTPNTEKRTQIAQ